MLRELRQRLGVRDLDERATATFAPQRVRGRHATGQRPMSATVRRQHRVEDLGLIEQYDAAMREHCEKIRGHEVRVDGRVVPGGTRADERDLERLGARELTEMTRGGDGRRNE